MLGGSRTKRRTPAPLQYKSFKTWAQGYVSAQSVNRTPVKGLRSSLNTILQQDGTIRPRPGRTLYGPQPVGTVLGEICEFVKRSGGTSETYMVSVQVVAGVASVYVAKGEDSTWTICSGKTFDTTARCHFCPIRDVDSDYNDEDKILITNKVDNLAYVDINTLTVVPFVALPSTSINALTVGSGLTGTTFTLRYRVTASKLGASGETAASTTVTCTVTKIRDVWSGTSEYVDVVINRVTGADKYHIYEGNTIGSEAYLYSVDDPGSGTTVTWRDTGTISPDPYRTAPLGDTTAGPICERASFINGQVFLVGDKNNPKYVRFGGTGTNLLDFSPYGGGGYQPVGGNKEIPVAVKSFRDNTGTPAITVICSGTNGRGKRYIFLPSSTTIGSTIVNYFAVREENGNDGTDSPDAVILARDQLWYPSRDGFKTTLTKAQVQTILSTEGVSDLIQPDIERLNTLSLANACGLTFENRLYFALPVGSDHNNEIWVLDLSDLRKGAWMRPWEVAADWMLLYNDNSGSTHFLTLENNQILEFTYSVATQDNGVAFSTGASTGMIFFTKTGQDWAEVERFVFVLQRPTGNLTVNITGRTEDSLLASLGSATFMSQNDVVGWDEPGRRWDTPGASWDAVVTVPQQYGVDQTEIEVEISEELKWFIAEISSQTAGVDYELTDLFVEYTETGPKNNS